MTASNASRAHVATDASSDAISRFSSVASNPPTGSAELGSAFRDRVGDLRRRLGPVSGRGRPGPCGTILPRPASRSGPGLATALISRSHTCRAAARSRGRAGTRLRRCRTRGTDRATRSRGRVQLGAERGGQVETQVGGQPLSTLGRGRRPTPAALHQIDGRERRGRRFDLRAVRSAVTRAERDRFVRVVVQFGQRGIDVGALLRAAWSDRPARPGRETPSPASAASTGSSSLVTA